MRSSFVTLILVVAVFTAGSYARPSVPSLQFLSIKKVRAMILERNETGQPVYNHRKLLMNVLPDQVVFALFDDVEWTSTHLFSIMKDSNLTCNITGNVTYDREQHPLGNFILERVLELDMSLSKRYSDNDFESLLKPILPCLTNLKRLNLSGMKIGDVGAKFIANSELKNLKHLNLDYADIGDDGVIEIAGKMNQLVSLSLQGNEFSLKGNTAIAKHLKTLEYLNVRYCHIGIQGALSMARNLTLLRHLELGMNLELVDEVFPLSEMTQNMDELVSLIVSNMKELVTLRLDFWNLNDDHAVAIASNLPHLKHLSLHKNEIGPIGAKAISPKLKDLEVLNLSENRIGDEGAIAITHHMKNLQKLYLSNCGIGDQGAIAIAGLNFKILTDLVLFGNRIGDDGVKAIAANENVKSLNYLNLNYNLQVSKTFAKNIKERLENHIKIFYIETF